MRRLWIIVATILFVQLAVQNANSAETASVRELNWGMSQLPTVATNTTGPEDEPEDEPEDADQEETEKDRNSPWWIRGRLVGYTGKWPFYIAAMVSRDFSDPANPIAWVRVDENDGRFDLPVTTPGVNAVYLLGQLDRTGRSPRPEFRFSGGTLQFVRRLPVHRDDAKGKRLLIDVEGVELAHELLEHGTWIAIYIALGIAFLLYGVGFLVVRKLRPTTREKPTPIDAGGWPLWLIAFGTTLPLLPTLGREALELLEFTYLHEGVRPESVMSLLSDQISAELSHPPVWPLLLRAVGSISHAEWWLRLPSILCHLGFVFVLYRIGCRARCQKTGWLTALIGGLAPIAFYYAQDATPYALLALISAGTTLCILEERWKTFAILIIVGFFTHYTVAVLAVAIAVALIWAWQKSRDNGWLRRVLGAYGLICILPLFWSVHFIVTFFASGLATRRMSLDYLPETGFLDYVSHFLTIAVGLPPELKWCMPVTVVIIGYGAYKCIRERPVLGRLVSVQALALLAYVLFVYSMYMYFAGGRVFYAYRWTTVFLPALTVCTAYGVMSLGQLWQPIGIAAGVLVIGGALAQDARITIEHKRPDQHAAREVIDRESQPGDAFCALPAIYYGQLFNYVLEGNYPRELLAWPAHHGNLYGPLHPRNSTLETLSTNLAFRRLWVADFHEEMFGTAKFDSELADHQLEWMKKNLLFNPKTDIWSFPKLTLYRFDVPNEPTDPDRRAWKDKRLRLDFSKRIQLFRYFPDLLHSQETGQIMVTDKVRVRVPAPPFWAKKLQLTVRMNIGKLPTSADLTVDGKSLKFSVEDGWGVWQGRVTVTPEDRIDIRLKRSKRATEHHLNTILTLEKSTVE